MLQKKMEHYKGYGAVEILNKLVTEGLSKQNFGEEEASRVDFCRKTLCGIGEGGKQVVK